MSESGFDVLNKFAPVNGGTITYAPYKPTAEQENEIIDAGQMAQKNQITNEIAERQVNDTNMFNYYANLYAGQMLPIKQAQDLAMENYALQLGLGKRYTAEDFRNTAQAVFDGRLGPLDWVERRPLSEGNRAFREIREGRIAFPKILLSPNDD